MANGENKASIRVETVSETKKLIDSAKDVDTLVNSISQLTHTMTGLSKAAQTVGPALTQAQASIGQTAKQAFVGQAITQFGGGIMPQGMVPLAPGASAAAQQHWQQVMNRKAYQNALNAFGFGAGGAAGGGAAGGGAAGGGAAGGGAAGGGAAGGGAAGGGAAGGGAAGGGAAGGGAAGGGAAGGFFAGASAFASNAGMGRAAGILGRMGTLGGGLAATGIGTAAVAAGAVLNFGMEGATIREEIDRILTPIERRAGIVRDLFRGLGQDIGYGLRETGQFMEQYGAVRGAVSSPGQFRRLMALERLTGLSVMQPLGGVEFFSGGKDVSQQQMVNLIGEMERRGFTGGRRQLYLQRLAEEAGQVSFQTGRVTGVDDMNLMLRMNMGQALFGRNVFGQQMDPVAAQELGNVMQGAGGARGELFLRRAFSRSMPGMTYSDFRVRQSMGLEGNNLQDVYQELRSMTGGIQDPIRRRETAFQILEVLGIKDPRVGRALGEAIQTGVPINEILLRTQMGEGAEEYEARTGETITGRRIADIAKELAIPDMAAKRAQEELQKYLSGVEGIGAFINDFKSAVIDFQGAVQQFATRSGGGGSGATSVSTPMSVTPRMSGPSALVPGPPF